MNSRHLAFSVLTLALLLLGLRAQARSDDVEVDILGANGRPFSTFPVRSEARDVHRAYLEARNQQTYRIRVRNRSAVRVGLVIAVDGRNIISGDKSELARAERMYILDPWESAQYEGWRTGSQRVNEFYFTEWRDSYAEAFGDRSARGVIAVAVYRERAPARVRREQERRYGASAPEADSREKAEPTDDASASRDEAPAPSANAAGRAAAPATEELARDRKSSTAGTGFGSEVYSPVRVVEFEPERSAASRHFIKYEWREALCRKSVIECERGEANRFWDEDSYGYAPYPPRRG